MKKKQGISLIVLVITIIVMIILATAVIITLNNVGIINKANDAVDKTNLKQVEQLANLAWADAYMNGARDKDELEDYVLDSLKDNKVNVDNYEIIVDQNGVTVKPGNGAASAPQKSPDGYYYNRLYYNAEDDRGFIIYPNEWVEYYQRSPYNANIDYSLPLESRLFPHRFYEPGYYTFTTNEDGSMISDGYSVYELKEIELKPLERNYKYVHHAAEGSYYSEQYENSYIILDNNGVASCYLTDAYGDGQIYLAEQTKMHDDNVQMYPNTIGMYGSYFKYSIDGEYILYNTEAMYKKDSPAEPVAASNKVMTGPWELKVTKEGINVIKAVISNGVDEIKVGSIVNYMPNGVGPTNYEYGWIVIGADEQGRVLLLSKTTINTVPTITYAFDEVVLKVQGLNVLETLNNYCALYKDGKLGILARTVTSEDINKITGYDKTTYEVGTINEYGKEVTFSWDGTAYPKYSYVSNGETITGNLTTDYSERGFVYFDTEQNKWVTSPFTTTPTDIVKVKNTAYRYELADYINNYYDLQNVTIDKMLLTGRLYNMLWGDYMLGDTLITTYKSSGLNYMVAGCGTWYVGITGNVYANSLNANTENLIGGTVRAVVTLSPNVKITESKVTPEGYEISI